MLPCWMTSPVSLTVTLAAWRISGDPCLQQGYQKRLQNCMKELGDQELGSLTKDPRESGCDEQSVDHVHTSVANIIKFLTKLHNDGLQYRTINTYRSAISKNHDLIEGVPVGKPPLVVRHTRAIFNQKPPLPK